MSSNTRYEVGDVVERQSKYDDRVFGVTDIREPESDSPTYILKPVGREDAKFRERENASDIQKFEPNTYRVWLNESTPASGDRREAARYRAYRLPDVKEAVKEDLIDGKPDDLEERYMGEDRIGLEWHEDPPEEMKDEGSDFFQGTTYTYEIEKDNSATFPMNLVTGGSAGRDLTGAE
jgi:hypothetical protein